MMSLEPLNEADRNFHKALTAEFESIVQYLGDSNPEASAEIHDRYWEAIDEHIERKSLSDFGIIFSFSEIARKYTDKQLLVAYYIADFAEMMWSKTGQQYPELFWIIVNTGILEVKDWIYTTVDYLTKTGGRSITRNYMISMLLQEQDEKVLRDLLHAFYYTGYSVDALKAVEVTLQTKQFDQSVHNYIFHVAYYDVIAWLNKDSVQAEDREFLRQFFTFGATLASEEYAVNCLELADKLK